MSVSQVKKRFGEFESYLRRDNEGLRRLKLLKDDVNVLRTSLAAAEEKAELAEAVKNVARERANKAETAFTKSEKENDRLNQIVAGLERRLSERTTDTQADVESDDSERSEKCGTEAEVKSVIKHVRKQIKEMPLAEKRIKIDGEFQSMFEKEQLIDGWSHNDLWTLGAIVALWSYVWGGVIITSKERSAGLKIDGDPDECALSRHLAQWMRRNIECKPTPENVLYDLTTM